VNNEVNTALDREIHKKRPSVGAVPGTLALSEDAMPTSLDLMVYDQETLEVVEVEEPKEILPWLDSGKVVWLNVHGLGTAETLLALAEIFSIHPLLLEDIVLTGGRGGIVDLEQVSILIGEGYVLTFQERSGDVFESVRARIRDGRGIIRKREADYLGYVLLDTIVDAYFPVIEEVGDCIDELEIDVFNGRSAAVLEALTELRSTLLSVRRSIWPLRDAVNAIIRDQPQQISSDVRVYLRDVLDHCVNASDMVETYRELSSGLLNTHLSVTSHKMNEIMKVLTVMSTIFIPLTFFSGLYGMNFDFMPELHWRWSYPALWIIMVTVSTVLLIYFRRRGWIGNNDS
jgi:magnesium transporter